MTLLSKTAILCANDLQTEDVEVPEWGGVVRVRSFTGRERDAFEASMVRGEGKDRKVDLTNMRARLVGLTVIDEGGQRLFTDDEVDLLGAKSGAALDRVFAIAQKLNGLSGADVEELTKNSSGVPSAVSTSDSALPLDSNTLTISSQTGVRSRLRSGWHLLVWKACQTCERTLASVRSAPRWPMSTAAKVRMRTRPITSCRDCVLQNLPPPMMPMPQQMQRFIAD